MLIAKVNGQEYKHFLTYSLDRDFDDAASVFELTMPYDPGNFLPAKTGSKVELTIDGIYLLTGYIMSTKTSVSKESGRVVTYSGKDSVVDLIDSSIGADVEFKGTVSLSKLVQATLKKAGLPADKVVNLTGEDLKFDSNHVQAGEHTESVFEFIQRYCKQKAVFLLADGKGNIILTRAQKTLIPYRLLHSFSDDAVLNNILEPSFSDNADERFNKYVIHSQGNPTGSAKTAKTNTKLAGIQATATDPEIRTSRILHLDADSEMSSAELQRRANWEASVRKARAMEYSCKIRGHFLGKTLVNINQLVYVKDEDNYVDRAMLITKATYKRTKDEGNITELVLKHPDTYLPEPVGEERRGLNRRRGRVAKQRERDLDDKTALDKHKKKKRSRKDKTEDTPIKEVSGPSFQTNFQSRLKDK